jgi:hypothetical protein
MAANGKRILLAEARQMSGNGVYQEPKKRVKLSHNGQQPYCIWMSHENSFRSEWRNEDLDQNR